MNENLGDQDQSADEHSYSDDPTLQLLQKAVDVKSLLLFLSLISAPQ
jgi:hypothetical protein